MIQGRFETGRINVLFLRGRGEWIASDVSDSAGAGMAIDRLFRGV